MSYPAILLFVYSRALHTQRTVESLLQNPQSKFHDLIIYSDGPKLDDCDGKVDEVRNYIKQIKGFKSITIRLRDKNYGLSKSIIDGVTESLIDFESVIVLEDDLVTSVYFLDYMNKALYKYKDDNRVISIHGYVYPIKVDEREAFFLFGADCWGWATWRRGWKLFNPDGKYLLDEINRKGLAKEFNFNNKAKFSLMLEDQISGKVDSWAIRWHASAFLLRMLTLHPVRSLVANIGHDDTGIHCTKSNNFNVSLSDSPIDFSEIDVIPSVAGFRSFEKFYGKLNSRLNKFKNYYVKIKLFTKLI